MCFQITSLLQRLFIYNWQWHEHFQTKCSAELQKVEVVFRGCQNILPWRVCVSAIELFCINLHWTMLQQHFGENIVVSVPAYIPEICRASEINFSFKPNLQWSCIDNRIWRASSTATLTCGVTPFLELMPVYNRWKFPSADFACAAFQIPLNLTGKEFGTNIILMLVWNWIRLLFGHEKGHSLVLYILVAFFLNEYLILQLYVFAALELINFSVFLCSVAVLLDFSFHN